MSETTLTQKELFRLSAVLYAETHDVVSIANIQGEIIRCIIAEGENDPLSYDDITANVESLYQYHIAEDEIIQAIARTQGKVFEIKKVNGQETVKLTPTAYKQTLESMEKNIDYYVDLFISEHVEIDKEKCKYAIQKYLYELTTSNINSYKVLLSRADGSQFSGSELSVDVRDLNDNERTMVHDFIEWNNAEKNVAISNIVLCCLEYCLLINGDQTNPLVKNVIRNRIVFLDTNIIFRALGINGVSRQNVIIAFLKKCQQANIQLFILNKTEDEFFHAIAYYIDEIRKYPRGQVFLGAYEMLSDYNVFSFYEAWRKSHQDSSLNYFSTYIRSLFISFCTDYKIKKEIIPPEIFNAADYKDKCNHYATSIQNKKVQLKDYYTPEDSLYSPRSMHDAALIAYAESMRDTREEKEDIFVTSSDKALRMWDMTRDSHTYPVVVYPSQLFLILIKMVGRSENDFKSFVSFINIRPRSNQLTPEKANSILSGISSVTEDVKTQKAIVEAVYNDDFQNIIKHSNTDLELFQNSQTYTQKYLATELEESNRTIDTLSQTVETQKDDIKSISQERDENAERAKYANQEAEKQREIAIQKDEIIAKKDEELNKKTTQIHVLAKSGTTVKYIWKAYILPVILLILTVGYLVFMGLQFFFADKEWNFAVKFFNWIKTTTFGLSVGDFVYAIDAAFAAGIWFLLKKWMRNPFNKLKKSKLRNKLIQDYIEKKIVNM